MLYYSIVWSNTSTQNINKLQSIQNFASKIVTIFRKFDQVTPLLRQLNWLLVKQLLYYRDCVLTYKCLNGLAPKYLVDEFTKRSSIHVSHTRNRDLLYIYHCIKLPLVSNIVIFCNIKVAQKPLDRIFLNFLKKCSLMCKQF